MWKLHSQEDRFRKHITFTKITKTFEIKNIKKNVRKEMVGQRHHTVPRWHHENHYNKLHLLFWFSFLAKTFEKLKRTRRKKTFVYTWRGWVSKWMNFLCLGGPLTAQAKELTTTGSGHCQPNFWKPLFMIGPKILHPMQLRATNLMCTRTICFQFVMSLLSKSCAGPMVSTSVTIHR